MGGGCWMERAEVDARHRDDAGGVWIITGWVLGFILYVGVVLAWNAGFTPAAPFVIIPAVLVVMIGGGNLIGGRSRRPSPQYNRPDPISISALRSDGAVTAARAVLDAEGLSASEDVNARLEANEPDTPTGGTGTER